MQAYSLQEFTLLFRCKFIQPYNGLMQEINIKEKEKCYLCKRETTIYKGTPIEKRYNFIEGAGQLCQECYEHCEALRFYTSP